MIILPRQQVLIAAVFDLVTEAENIIWFGFVERLKLSPKQTHVKETRFKIILMLKWTTLGSNLSYLHWYLLTAYQNMCCIFPVFKYTLIVKILENLSGGCNTFDSSYWCILYYLKAIYVHIYIYTYTPFYITHILHVMYIYIYLSSTHSRHSYNYTYIYIYICLQLK